MSLQEEFKRQGNWMFCRRSYLPIVVLLACYLQFVSNLYQPSVVFSHVQEAFPHYRYFCLTVSLAGLLIRIYTVGHTPSGTSGRNTHGQVAESLNTTGLYSVVRHPLYVGNFVIYFGIVLLTCSPMFGLIFVLSYWVYCERIMYAEEQFLKRKFVDSYREWSNGVPAFLPRFGNWVKPSLSFSWKKALRQEKNGLLAIFLVYATFHLTQTWALRHHPLDNTLLGLTAVSLAAYVVLKLLKKQTKCLADDGR